MSFKKSLRKRDKRSFSKFLSCNVLVTFKQHFQCILHQLKILYFLYSYRFFICIYHILETIRLNEPEFAQNLKKNIFSKCVLDLKWAPFLPWRSHFPEKIYKKNTAPQYTEKKHNSKITSAL
jgi:hypothetical protein